MREASARRRRRKIIFLSPAGALVLGAVTWLMVHFIPKPLTWILPKQSVSEVLYWVDDPDGAELIELDDAQQAELIKLLGEVKYRRRPMCRCTDGLKLIVRYKDGTTAHVGDHWIKIGSRYFSIKLFDGNALFKYAPEGLRINPAD